MKKEVIVYKESLLQSVAADFTTFFFLALLMAFNRFYLGDSKVAAFVFFVVFLTFVLGKGMVSEHTFTDKKKLQEFIDNL